MGSVFTIEVDWPKQVATSPIMPPLVYVIFTFIVAAIFVALQIVHLGDFIEEFGWFYLIFLTNWTLILETLTTVCLFISAVWGYTVSETTSAEKAPFFIKFTLALWYIIQPMSLIVVILYWTVVNQFWDPYPVEFSSYWAHLFSWMFLLTWLFVSRIPLTAKNFIWSLLFLLAYLVWTIIHFVARIGREKPCADYPQELCPIYDLFNWNEPGLTIGITIGALAALAVVDALYFGFVRCRDSCDRGYSTQTAPKDVADVEA